MAKSMRSKREKRLRTLRRKIAEPLYAAKDEAKFAVMDEILNAPSQYTVHLTSMSRRSSATSANCASAAGGAETLRESSGDEPPEKESMEDEGMCVDGAQNPCLRKTCKKYGDQKVGGVQKRVALKKKVKLSRKTRRKMRKKNDFPV